MATVEPVQPVMLGLGSNVGDRMASLRHGVTLLTAELRIIRISRVYASQALLPDDAPADWDAPFLNLALHAETTLSPLDLLDYVKTVERAAGRVARGHWSPRELDIDILAYAQHVMRTPRLTLPHAGLLTRPFALVPFAEIAPEWLYLGDGGAGRTMRALAEGMSLTLHDEAL